VAILSLPSTQGNSLPIRAKAKNAQEREEMGRASRERGKLRGRSRGREEGKESERRGRKHR
jgi:hypothetical protein